MEHGAEATVPQDQKFFLYVRKLLSLKSDKSICHCNYNLHTLLKCRYILSAWNILFFHHKASNLIRSVSYIINLGPANLEPNYFQHHATKFTNFYYPSEFLKTKVIWGWWSEIPLSYWNYYMDWGRHKCSFYKVSLE